LFAKIGDTKHSSWPLIRMGEAFLVLGDIQKAVIHMADGLEIAESVGNKRDIAWATKNLGAIFLCHGVPDSAQEAFQKSIQLFRETE